MADPARAEKLLTLLEDRDRLIDDIAAMLHQYRGELQALNADYDVNRELAVEMLDYYNRDRAQKQLAFIGLLNAMKRATTAAEWQVVARFQLDHSNPHALVYAPAPGGG